MILANSFICISNCLFILPKYILLYFGLPFQWRRGNIQMPQLPLDLFQWGLWTLVYARIDPPTDNSEAWANSLRSKSQPRLQRQSWLLVSGARFITELLLGLLLRIFLTFCYKAFIFFESLFIHTGTEPNHRRVSFEKLKKKPRGIIY